MTKKEFEEHLQAAKDKGGHYVVFEVEGFDVKSKELFAYSNYEQYFAEIECAGFKAKVSNSE